MISLIKEIDDNLPIMPSAVRILSLYESYGCKFDFLRFYKQVINDATTAIISVMDNNATVCVISSPDFDEIVDFLSVIGVETVFCEEELALEKIEQGTVMLFCNEHEKKYYSKCTELESIYNIMSTCFDMPDFTFWYADISHRARHNGAVTFQNEYGCAVVLKSSVGALISGICVTSSNRKQGYGSIILREIIAVSCCKSIFALVDENGPKAFYKKNGFSDKGKFATYKVK